MRDNPSYAVWRSMLQRCRPGYKKPQYYEGRGIKVCERWESFHNFLADMGTKPKGMTLDRINNDKGYEPGNCRWATYGQQNRNYRRNVNLTFRGETLTAKDWAARLGIPEGRIYGRVKMGWKPEAILTVPKQVHHCRQRSPWRKTA